MFNRKRTNRKRTNKRTNIKRTNIKRTDKKRTDGKRTYRKIRRKRTNRKIRRKSKSRRLRGGTLTTEDWRELDPHKQKILDKLKISPESWDNDKEQVFYDKVRAFGGKWDSLSPVQRKEWGELGVEERDWNKLTEGQKYTPPSTIAPGTPDDILNIIARKFLEGGGDLEQWRAMDADDRSFLGETHKIDKDYIIWLHKDQKRFGYVERVIAAHAAEEEKNKKKSEEENKIKLENEKKKVAEEQRELQRQKEQKDEEKKVVVLNLLQEAFPDYKGTDVTDVSDVEKEFDARKETPSANKDSDLFKLMKYKEEEELSFADALDFYIFFGVPEEGVRSLLI